MCLRVRIHLHTWAHLAASVFSISLLSSLPVLAFQRITPLAGPLWCLGTPACIPQHHRGCLRFKNSPCELVQKGRKRFRGWWRGLSVTATLMLAQLKQLKTFIDDQIQLQGEQSTSAKFTMTMFRFFLQAKHTAYRMPSPVPPCFCGEGLCFEYHDYICCNHDPPE